eukprot:1048175-Prymnesium_polylepis.1
MSYCTRVLLYLHLASVTLTWAPTASFLTPPEENRSGYGFRLTAVREGRGAGHLGRPRARKTEVFASENETRLRFGH